jgi:thiol:disulfide interchange protein
MTAVRFAWTAAVALAACARSDAAPEAVRPAVVIYTAQWCAACRVFERDTLAAPEVRAELAHFRVTTIDVTEDDGPARRDHVDALPTIVLSNVRLVGAPSAPDFIAALRHAR